MSGLDEALERRLAEIMSAAGVPHARAALEVLYMLPRDFLTGYMELFDDALKFGEGHAGERGEEAKSSGGKGIHRGKMPMLGAGGKRYKEHWTIKSEEALDLKKTIDKRLRAIGRDIRNRDRDKDGESDERTRCSRCGRIMARDWNFCAGCGNHRPVGGE